MHDFLTALTYKIEQKATKAGLVYKLACKYYRGVVQREIALANITAKDHILCIGGGICPLTAVLFHQLTGAKVTVIDNNHACIAKATRFVGDLGLGAHVAVHCQDGSSRDMMYADFTVIHVALQVSPREQVLASVEGQMVPGTRLLVRRPKGRGQVLSYCPYARHKSRNIGSTALSIKLEDTFEDLAPAAQSMGMAA